MTTQADSTSDLLNKVANWDRWRPHDISQVLNAAFDANDYLDCIRDLWARNIDPFLYIENLDMVSSFSVFGGPSIHHNREIDHR